MADRMCPACGRGILTRCARKGLWEEYVLPLFGVFPWRCGRCRMRFRLSDRGAADFKRLERTSKLSDHEAVLAEAHGAGKNQSVVYDSEATAEQEDKPASI